MEKINTAPVRFSDAKSTVKKGLFSKKEAIKCAVCDENGSPLSEYLYDSIEAYSDGVATAHILVTSSRSKTVFLDLNGKELLKKYTDKGYTVTKQDGYFFINGFDLCFGLAALDGTILIEPVTGRNKLSIADDIVIYGEISSVGPEYNKLQAGRLCDGKLTDILPRTYTLVSLLEGGIIAAGRMVESQTREMASLTKDIVARSVRGAFMLYSKDGTLLSDKVFGELHKTKSGNYSGTVCPKITPEDLYYKTTTSDTFNGTGGLDFSGSKQITLEL